jgi:hypothetical protein
VKTGVRLVDGSRVLILHPSLDYVPQALTVSSPEVREVAENRTDDDGARDTTTLYGARAVSLEITAIDDRTDCEVLLDAVKRFLHPRSRPYLHVTDDGWAQERRIRLRVDQWSEPYVGYAASRSRAVQLQWKAPDGVWEGVEAEELTVLAAVAATTGRSYPKVYPWAYAPTLSTAATIVGSVGSVPSHFTARLYGPCAGPRLINETTGEVLAFTTDLSLAAGEYVEISTRDRSAFALSNPAASRLNYIDFETTSWWQIEPGDNKIRYAPESASAGSAAVITYRPAWL